MKNKIISILVISLMLTQVNYAVIVSGDTNYRRKTNEEYITKVEVYKYYTQLQNWLDRDSAVELLRKVASHSELKGYKSEATIDWEHLYDDQDTKATRSNIE